MKNSDDSGETVSVDATSTERRVSRLAAERTALFGRAATHPGLSAVEQQRLSMIERELDDCFLARRRQRAERDANRFESGRALVGRPTPRSRT